MPFEQQPNAAEADLWCGMPPERAFHSFAIFASRAEFATTSTELK
jgi:hypothetical protein